MSLIQNLINDDTYKKEIEGKISRLKNTDLIPVGEIRSEDDNKKRNLNVYCHMPIILLAIEKEIGEEKMWS